MVIPRKWKVVAGTMTAAVAFGAGAAAAEEGSGEAAVDELRSELVDTVEIQQLPALGDVESQVLVEEEGDTASPFDSISEESPESEPSPESEESPESEPSPESEESPESEPSPESLDDSVSEASVDSE